MNTAKQVRDENNDVARDRYTVRTNMHGSKEVTTYFKVLPGEPQTDEDKQTREECTHVRVTTRKNSVRKAVVSRAHEVVVRPDGMVICRHGSIIGGVGGDWSATLAEEKRVATDKALVDVHYKAVNKLRDLRPELFYNEEEMETRNKQRQFIDEKYVAAGLAAPAW